MSNTSITQPARRTPARRAGQPATPAETPAAGTRAARYAAAPSLPEPTIPFGMILLLIGSMSTMSVVIGVTLFLFWQSEALIAIPMLTDHAYLLLSRASAFVAYSLLWLSMALGISITSKLSRIWPGGPTAVDVPRHISLLAIGFTTFHVLTLLGARLGYSPLNALLPIAGATYRPFWMGLLGKTGLYSMAIVGLSFYVRTRIGQRTWRAIHFLSFLSFLVSLSHAVAAGTDTRDLWAQAIYGVSLATLLILIGYRIWQARMPAAAPKPRPARADQQRDAAGEPTAG